MTDPRPETSDAMTPPRYLVPLLAAFASLVILTTDVYLPVLPDLARDLGTSDAAASATVSLGCAWTSEGMDPSLRRSTSPTVGRA